METRLFVILAAYLIGSLPTALLVSKAVAGVDIREIGDGNMGARNITRTLGWGAGVFVAAVDFSKGAIVVLLARAFDFPVEWQLVAGVCAVLGHDFPIWAHFRGGQGMAAILGLLFILLPSETIWGLAAFSVVFLVTHVFDLSATIGLGLLAAMVWLNREPILLLGYVIFLFLTLPVKKAIDWPRRIYIRKRMQAQVSLEDISENTSVEHGNCNGNIPKTSYY